MELKDIKIIIDLMKKNDLSVFEMEEGDFKIKLKRGGSAEAHASAGAPVIYHHPPPALTLPAAPAGVPTAAAEAPATAAAPAAKGGVEIVSPMVGTFYSAISPDAAPYVKVGQSVTEDTVVCIVEAMKVMNEIKAEKAGIVAEILAENGKPVQYGQALFRLQ